MKDEHRRELLRVMARIEQLAAETEALTIEAPDDEILLTASAQLAEHRRLLADVEWKFKLGRSRMNDASSEVLKNGRLTEGQITGRSALASRWPEREVDSPTTRPLLERAQGESAA